jgi:hypothetical protein
MLNFLGWEVYSATRSNRCSEEGCSGRQEARRDEGRSGRQESRSCEKGRSS